MYRFREYCLRENTTAAIQRYIDHGIDPGSFLRAALSNNLKETLGRADEDNLANIPALGAYLYNEVPAICWGDEETVREWIKKKGANAPEDPEK